MRCDEFEVRLHELLDQRANLLDDGELNQHSQHCRACRAWRDAMLTLTDGAEMLIEPTVGDLTSRVVNKVRRARSNQATRQLILWAAPMASLLILAAWSWQQSSPPTHSPAAPPIATALTTPEVTTSDQDALQLLASLSNWNVPWLDSTSPSEPPAGDTAPATATPLGFESLTRSATEAFDMLWQGLPIGAEEPRS